MGQAGGDLLRAVLTRQHAIEVGVVLLFLVAYSAQPLLVDVIKINGGAHPSTFSVLIPHYYSMVLVGTLPTKQKLSECDWRRGMILSTLDIINQLLKKAGLLYSGAAVYIVIDSSSIVWTAIWSMVLLRRKLKLFHWVGIGLITLGISLKACQLNFTFHDEEFLGVILTLVASILMGLTFVLNEKYMKGVKKIEGPNLVCMMGVCCAVPITLWTLFWTVPRFSELVIDPVREHNGSFKTVACCFFWLFASCWLHSGTLWFLMANYGAVSTGILKGVKVALVFLFSHVLFCDIQPHQCLNVWTGTSALICVTGVILYSFAKIQWSGKSEDKPTPDVASEASPTSIEDGEEKKKVERQ
ncbi:putative transporter/permease protein [Toxoplasma gondii TgCatPRC2]|uniref:Transporter/permease protein, putative n=14 Tax=Toxoplasma gondii TaxID=5811 RepID=A0A125YPD6_TOXGM|nr:transporter/permease protein, putative [Toxoplasma gondii ME49]EPR57119.1 putative transporter/permease protein [Toxoplasma gondii GT1]ESS33498.1 putative transporter/permease protein [Toxoplasma gondii VEG]KAF4644126.1 putative transporter/permease protein [Toxoplasma gondii]KFG28127.1 putative transporter/permease protein [Toxoplasma gondii p89]KFG38761.1 putative transporter/permease protein [Toxoplasma gondii GAB2-2007-GAL-DOM2]KFG43158.1 putative transporter/permease protein [Toxoplas|eukprot:XP_002368754.1 transporter/permease protein, putative [Toxoplasma gondii ME49]